MGGGKVLEGNKVLEFAKIRINSGGIAKFTLLRPVVIGSTHAYERYTRKGTNIRCVNFFINEIEYRYDGLELLTQEKYNKYLKNTEKFREYHRINND